MSRRFGLGTRWRTIRVPGRIMGAEICMSGISCCVEPGICEGGFVPPDEIMLTVTALGNCPYVLQSPSSGLMSTGDLDVSGWSSGSAKLRRITGGAAPGFYYVLADSQPDPWSDATYYRHFTDSVGPVDEEATTTFRPFMHGNSPGSAWMSSLSPTDGFVYWVPASNQIVGGEYAMSSISDSDPKPTGYKRIFSPASCGITNVDDWVFINGTDLRIWTDAGLALALASVPYWVQDSTLSLSIVDSDLGVALIGGGGTYWDGASLANVALPYHRLVKLWKQCVAYLSCDGESIGYQLTTYASKTISGSFPTRDVSTTAQSTRRWSNHTTVVPGLDALGDATLGAGPSSPTTASDAWGSAQVQFTAL